ncbi:MAG: DUF2169 domain-containing protein [Polyangiaceae bacterium]
MTTVVEMDLVPTAPVSVGARAWAHRGRYRLTAIVKAAFTLEQDAPMRLAAPAPLIVRDVTRGNAPLAAARRAAELALYLRRAEISLDATAFAPRGQTVEHMKVRLAVARGDRMLLSKELRVVGDRTSVDGEVPRPLPFSKMPIVYERAFGGHGNADNPVGVGAEGGGRITMPNVIGSDTPGAPRIEPCGFGPIAASWPVRRAKLGAFPRMEAEEAVWAAMPDAFDETFFQAAPLDQQVDDLLPSDMLAFVGMHPDLPTLRVAIPHVRGIAIAEAENGRRVQIPTRLDMVFVEPHAMRAELVFRGVIEMTPEFLRGLRVAGALEEPPAQYHFPPLVPLLPTKGRRVRNGESMSPATDAPPAGPARAAVVGTMMLDDSGPRPSTSGTMLADELGPGSAGARPKATFGTMPLAGPSEPPSSLPFKRGALPRRRSSMKVPAQRVLVPAKVIPATPGVLSTMVLDEPPPAAPPSPSVVVPSPPSPSVAVAPAPAVADSGAEDAPAKPKPTDTYAPPDMGEILAKKQAQREAEQKAAAAAPSVDPKAPKAAVWAEPTNDLTSPSKSPKPAPRPVVQPAPDRKAQLYKKFKP